jgi:DNA-binding transcriptional LysR family regulator
MDVFSDMTVFVEVVRANSFSKGADNLGMPASTVSRRISELEKRLGLRLLTRTTRKIALTDVGEIYYGRCRRLVEEAKLAQEELSDTLNNAKGQLKMSLPADFAIYHLAPVLLAFLHKHPDITYKLDLTPKQVDLTSDPFDLAIRIGELPDSSLIGRKITELSVSLFASPDYLAECEPLTSPRDLEQHLTLNMNESSWILHKNKESFTTKADHSIIANSIGMLMKLTASGAGIAPLPRIVVNEEIERGQLQPVLPEWQFKFLPVYALTETRLLPAKTRLFIEFLVDHFTSQSLT